MPATPYYVDGTNGLDTNDGTSLALAWKTISKAIATIATDVEATCDVEPGTYLEDTGGGGILSIQRNRTELLTVRSSTGVAADVIITGASSATYNVYFATGTTAKLKFHDVTFQSRVNTQLYLVAHHANAVLDNVTFNSCRFVQLIGGNATAKTGLYINHTTDVDVTNLAVTNCTFETSGTLAETVVNNMVLSRTHLDAQLATVTVTGNKFSSPKTCCLIYGATVLDFSDNVATSGSGICVSIGQDSATNAQATGGTVANNWIRGGTSHGLLIGYGCSGVTVSGNHVCGGDVGLSVKDCTLVTVTGNYCEVGTLGVSGALTVKGGTHSVLSGNVVVSRCPTVAAVQIRFELGAHPRHEVPRDHMPGQHHHRDGRRELHRLGRVSR